MMQVSLGDRPAVKRSWITAPISPGLPVPASASDAEAIYRFPCGYPHIVSFNDATGALVYAVRMRGADGHLGIVGDETADLQAAQEALSLLMSALLQFKYSSMDYDVEEKADETFRAVWWPGGGTLLELPVETCTGWPKAHLQSLDFELLETIPRGFPIILADEEDGERWYIEAYRDRDGNLFWSDWGHRWTDDYAECVRLIEEKAIRRFCMWEKHVWAELSRPVVVFGR